MREYKLPLTTEKDSGWEAKHAPVLTVRAQYQPYAAIRQKFWRQYIKQYDTDDTNTISQLELTSMLDSLGSTLSHDTVDNFFTRFGKSPAEGELTADEVIQCLETEVTRPPSEKRKISIDQTIGHTNVPTPTTPGNQISRSPEGGNIPLSLDKLDFTGQAALPPSQETQKIVQAAVESIPTANNNLEPSQKPLSDQLQPNAGVESSRPVPPVRHSTGNITPGSTSSSDAYDSTNDSGETVERVINIKTCPLCHRPRMNAKAEMDIVTHLAVCASQDWARVDRIVVGNFVTASQAQRKWYTKVMTIVSSGTYQLGANSANIIVQNRMTGKLEEEKMQGYVRVGIRLLYKGVKGRMEGSRARNLLKSMSIKQGVKYNSPESAREIPSFIAFHNLDVNEIRDPLPSFKSFNEFFYRKLKEDARPVDSPNDPTVLVSGADCRLMAFESVNEATRIWIKGREFSVQRLLGPAYADDAAKFTGGALCIFRLAPQDYHRFHSPVDGRIGPMTYIAGEYYTVNPQAIRTSLDVYGENARKIVPIDSPTFGRVMAVCVGAMMVGSIVTTVQEGEEVKRGQEFGYFAFGGSTIVLLVQPGAVQWDEDLLINGRASLETLVRVGMRIGKKPSA
jgi:phosphatidylserine decarboxylase